MLIKMKTSAMMLASSAALLLAGCASDDGMAEENLKPDSNSALGKCHGVNSCKGTSACATATSVCAGQNTCKGQGWVSANKVDCDAKGGKFIATN